ncbi:MAG TPA: hypothetical protein VID29_06260 [Solirubrobacteraceae bacterium]
MGAACPAGGGDENGYASVVELFAADLVLDQEASPAVNEVAGPLAEDATVSGSSDVAFHAADPGSGVYEAIFQVDGQTVKSVVLNANGGRCHDVGQTGDGLPAFLYTQPCPAALSVDVPFDTTGVGDGSHHLIVNVSDAAGNTTPVLDRQIAVANAAQNPGGGTGGSGGGQSAGGSPQGGSPQGGAGGGSPAGTGAGESRSLAGPAPSRGAANGSGASDHATLSAHWHGVAGVHVTDAYGQTRTIEGRLTGPGGRPIAGALLDVGEQPATAGAHASALRGPRTDRAGRWRMSLPRGACSGALRLGYRSHLGDATPVATRTLTLSVRAGVLLRVAPRVSGVGHEIRLSGRLRGAPLPTAGKQIVLEARSPGSGWLQFHVVRTDARGAFHFTYRFRFAGPALYTFRALCTYEADYPFLAGVSNLVGVRER